MPVLPITDELIYQYDFGDGWGVKITCVEQYYTQDRLDDAGNQFVAVSLDNQDWLDETRVYNHMDEQIISEEREMRGTCILSEHKASTLNDKGTREKHLNR